MGFRLVPLLAGRFINWQRGYVYPGLTWSFNRQKARAQLWAGRLYIGVRWERS